MTTLSLPAMWSMATLWTRPIRSILAIVDLQWIRTRRPFLRPQTRKPTPKRISSTEDLLLRRTLCSSTSSHVQHCIFEKCIDVPGELWRFTPRSLERTTGATTTLAQHGKVGTRLYCMKGSDVCCFMTNVWTGIPPMILESERVLLLSGLDDVFFL